MLLPGDVKWLYLAPEKLKISRNIGVMTSLDLPHDPKWPRARTLFNNNALPADIGIIGIPAYRTSISQTAADKTPAAIRLALARYSTYSGSTGTDLSALSFVDLGDVTEPDFEQGEQRVAQAVASVRENLKLLIAMGGDNSITYSVANGVWPDLSQIGLITLDAHHDLRDGNSNGSPVWRLIQNGLSGGNVVQIGIADFANSAEYAQRAKDAGIHVIFREELRARSINDVMAEALEIAGENGREIYVDIDVDVCDRSVAPGCPASAPGGISADELRQAARLAGADSRVRVMDITEIDVEMDAPDQRTIRLAGLLILEAAVGVSAR